MEANSFTETVAFERGKEISERKDRATLYGKMANVMLDLQNQSKDGKNNFHKYEYISAEQVANAVRGLMGKHGIAFFVEMTGVEDDKKDDKVLWVHYEFTFACADTGATITKSWSQDVIAVNSKGGRDDKAVGKSHSYAVKYFLMKTFVMSAADDPDIDKDSQPTAAPVPFFSDRDRVVTWLKSMEAEHGLDAKAVLEILNNVLGTNHDGLSKFGDMGVQTATALIVKSLVPTDETTAEVDPQSDPKDEITVDGAQVSDDSVSAEKK